jgi:hypothetical protein
MASLRAAALSLLLLPAAAQIDAQAAQCGAQLTAMSDALNGACCSTTACTNGVPSACNAACAGIWMPFQNTCDAFIRASLPELRHFGSLCAASAGPAPPPAAAANVPTQALYVEVTIPLRAGSAALGSGKAADTARSAFRADMAAALGKRTDQIIIGATTPTSLDVDIFVSDQAEAQAVQAALNQQIVDANSVLLQGQATSSIVPGVPANWVNGQQGMHVTTLSAAAAGAGEPGVFHIAADNAFEAFVNSVAIGSGQDYRNTFDLPFAAPCDDGQVFAIHGRDAGGPAAIIASAEHCGHNDVTRLAWKCVGQDPGDGWTDPSFDDSQWPVAVTGGPNGVAPWGVREGIPLEASWIWAESIMDTQAAWCRIRTGGHDYDDGLYSHPGWDDGQVHLTADDNARIYVNGEQIGETTTDQWSTTVRIPIAGDIASCQSKTVYAIDAQDSAGAAGIIATINHCGESISTQPARWKCNAACPDGWEGLDFDDSSWEVAVDGGINGDTAPQWERSDVADEAHWIWAAGNNKALIGSSWSRAGSCSRWFGFVCLILQPSFSCCIVHLPRPHACAAPLRAADDRVYSIFAFCRQEWNWRRSQGATLRPQ